MISRRAVIAGLILAAAICVRLGFWQLDRLEQRREANRTAAAARARPPVPLARAGGWPAESLANRWVTARGEYDARHQIIVRSQAFQGVPGIHLVTPLQLDGSDSAVLVNRGFVPAPDAVRAETAGLSEEGDLAVTGLALPIDTGHGRPVTSHGRTSWARLDLNALRDSVPYPILPVYLRQAPDSSLPRLPRRLAPPALDDGPHLNYAIQWFLFAVMTVAFAVLVVGRGRRTRP